MAEQTYTLEWTAPKETGELHCYRGIDPADTQVIAMRRAYAALVALVDVASVAFDPDDDSGYDLRFEMHGGDANVHHLAANGTASVNSGTSHFTQAQYIAMGNLRNALADMVGSHKLYHAEIKRSA